MRGRDRPGDLRLDLPAAAKAGVEEPGRGQPVEAGAVILPMFGLPAHGHLPIEAKPTEILVDPSFELGAAALRVDILDAQQEAPLAAAREAKGQQRRIGVAQMQVARGAGGETGDEGLQFQGMHMAERAP